MNFLDLFLESLGTLTLNKTRTGLAILGIGSVIALISLGQSSSQQIQSQIESLGANLLTVQPGSANQGAVRGAQGGGQTLTLADAEAISTSTTVTSVGNVSPEFSRRAQVITGGNNTNTSVIGVVPVYTTVHKVSIDTGSFITEQSCSSRPASSH